MNGPKVICCGCDEEISLDKPMCDECMNYGFDILIDSTEEKVNPVHDLGAE